MNCVQCNKLTITKCKNTQCKNQVQKCYSCWYDYKLERIDKQFDVISYCSLPLIESYTDSNLDKVVQTIWCGKCNYYTQLYLKYGKNIPIIALQFEDVTINIEWSNYFLSTKQNIEVNIGSKMFLIPVKELFIRQEQYYRIKGDGLSHINENDIYDVDDKCDIIFKIIISI